MSNATPTPPAPPRQPVSAARVRRIWNALRNGREELSYALTEASDAGLQLHSLRVALRDVAQLEAGFGQLVAKAEAREERDRRER